MILNGQTGNTCCMLVFSSPELARTSFEYWHFTSWWLSNSSTVKKDGNAVISKHCLFSYLFTAPWPASVCSRRKDHSYLNEILASVLSYMLCVLKKKKKPYISILICSLLYSHIVILEFSARIPLIWGELGRRLTLNEWNDWICITHTHTYTRLDLAD